MLPSRTAGVVNTKKSWDRESILSPRSSELGKALQGTRDAQAKSRGGKHKVCTAHHQRGSGFGGSAGRTLCSRGKADEHHPASFTGDHRQLNIPDLWGGIRLTGEKTLSTTSLGQLETHMALFHTIHKN